MFEKFRRVEQTGPAPRIGAEVTPANPVPLPASKAADVNAVGNPLPTATQASSPSTPSSRTELPAAPTVLDKRKLSATVESEKTSVTDGTKAGVVAPLTIASTPSRPIAATPKPGVATSTASPTPKAKPAAEGDVPAARVGCERIFAKLSLGTAELTEAERQKLAACK